MRHHLTRCGLLIVTCCMLLACSRNELLHRHTVFVFGTLVEITLAGIPQDQADEAMLELERWLLARHDQWTPWQQSDLSEVNAMITAQREFAMPDSLAPLVARSQHYYVDSEGLFNPAIGGLIKLWQFHRHDEPGIRPPAAAAIENLLRLQPAITDLVSTNGTTRSTNPHVDLNFGAFAKGYAIDEAIALLAARGIDNAVVNAGGDLAVAGSHAARPWRIGIRHPRAPGIIASLEAAPGEAVFTSGDYERYYIHEGVRYNHILDPRTGYPATGVHSVTVIDEDAGKADAAATALFVAGVADWRRIARRMGIDHVMLIDDSGRVHMNPAMAARIRFEVTPIPPIVTDEPL